MNLLSVNYIGYLPHPEQDNAVNIFFKDTQSGTEYTYTMHIKDLVPMFIALAKSAHIKQRSLYSINRIEKALFFKQIYLVDDKNKLIIQH